jgi:hypothetical protein
MLRKHSILLGGITKVILVLIIIVLSVIAGTGAYAFYLNNQSAGQTPNGVSALKVVVPLAYKHWQSIGEKNVSSIMQGYSQYYEAVWWYFNGSTKLSAINGKHDCNVPVGYGNCTKSVLTVWEDFSNATIPLEYTLCEANFTLGSGNWLYARSIMWYTSLNLNETIRVPLEMDFRFEAGGWQLLRDWFGLPGDPATLMPGNIAHSCPGNQDTQL